MTIKINTNKSNFFIDLRTIAAASIAAFLLIAGLVTDATANLPERSFTTVSDDKSAAICDNGILNGDFAVIGTGFAAPPSMAPLPFATISKMTLDGMGNLTNKVTRSNNGTISRGVDVGTYNIDSDCTGTITIVTPNPPFQLTFDVVISQMLGARRATEFVFIATTPGGVVAASAKQVR
ncbi:MAG TPA: hypothetical protein VK918_01730 [Pyrinomonadaceae bacterium]|nr:hypothetical protein [Pyrinomonadaceae bacterium]